MLKGAGGNLYCIDRVMVLVLSTLSDSVLYLYQVLSQYLIEFQTQDLNSRVDARMVPIYKGALFDNYCRWNYGTECMHIT